MTIRRPRTGVTLTEVLVAIFTMAIGLLALLTLFPLGAMQMAQALKDDRTGGEAIHADAVLRSYWRSNALPGLDPQLVAALDDPTAAPGQVRGYPAFPTPGYYPTPTTNPTWFPGASPSYPVYVDPLGFAARTPLNLEKTWTAHFSGPGAVPAQLMPRRSLATLLTPNQVLQTCCLTDDLTFELNGTATGPVLERQGRYNWAAILQRPRRDTPAVVNLTVMVFDGRPPLLAKTTGGDEVLVNASLTVGERSVQLDVPLRDEGSAPLVRRGGWILDNTIGRVDLRSPPVLPGVEGVDFVMVRTAQFYRISGLTDLGQVGSANRFLLDLETPIKPLWNGQSMMLIGPAPAPLTYTARIGLFSGLAEVFERSQLRPDPSNN